MRFFLLNSKKSTTFVARFWGQQVFFCVQIKLVNNTLFKSI